MKLWLGVLFLATGAAFSFQTEGQTGAGTAPAGQGTDYEFTIDWVSNNVETWRRVLAEFRGRARVRALEIGSYEGRSAIWFLEEILTHPTSQITCVDLFEVPEIEARFDRNIQASGQSSRVEKIKGNSQIVLPKLAGRQFDFIYVDGSHTARDVLLDAALSWGLLVEHGLLLFDDYRLFLEWHPSRRPKMAIDAFLEVFDPYIDVVHSGYQVIVRKRSAAEIPPPPLERILGWRDVVLYLTAGCLLTFVSLFARRVPDRQALGLRAVAAIAGAALLGWAYSRDFEIFSQLKEVANFNAFSLLGTVVPALVGAVVALTLVLLLESGWRRAA